MAKVDTVGYWMDERGRVLNVVVNYDNEDVRSFPGTVFSSGTLPDDVKKFVPNAKEKDVIHLSNGKTLYVFYN